MGFKKIMDLMNYNYESKGIEFYNIYNYFINDNSEILTEEQLKTAKIMVLSPEGFGDERNRSQQEYNNLIINLENKLNNLEKGKGMV